MGCSCVAHMVRFCSQLTLWFQLQSCLTKTITSNWWREEEEEEASSISSIEMPAASFMLPQIALGTPNLSLSLFHSIKSNFPLLSPFPHCWRKVVSQVASATSCMLATRKFFCLLPLYSRQTMNRWTGRQPDRQQESRRTSKFYGRPRADNNKWLSKFFNLFSSCIARRKRLKS